MKLDRKYTDIEKRNFVQIFIASGDSMNRCCKCMGLPHSTFYGWVKKYSLDS